METSNPQFIYLVLYGQTQSNISIRKNYMSYSGAIPIMNIARFRTSPKFHRTLWFYVKNWMLHKLL